MIILNIFTPGGVVKHVVNEKTQTKTISKAAKDAARFYKKGYKILTETDKVSISKHDIIKVEWELI